MAQHLTQASTRREPRRALHALVRAALPELPWDVLGDPGRRHLRILVPGDCISPVPLHTDFGIGHSLDERNLWIALTPAQGNAALQVATFDESLASDERRREGGRLLSDPATPTRPFEVERGEVLLFTPLHVHGARVLDGDQTRVSIDVRIAPLAAARERNRFAYIPLLEAQS